MPFVKKNDAQGSQPPTDARSIFIGRTGELLFFVQNILQPEDPTYNIISISGPTTCAMSSLKGFCLSSEGPVSSARVWSRSVRREMEECRGNREKGVWMREAIK